MEIPDRTAEDIIQASDGSVANSNRMRTDLNRAMAWRETLVLSFLLACGFIQCNGDAHVQPGELKSEAKRYLCRDSNRDYDCIFQNVFIDNLNNDVLFGHAEKQLNYQRRISFENSTIRSLPRSLVDTFANVELLNLERLQIYTIERDALKNGRHIKELFLSNNNIASLDAGVFDYLASLETLVIDGNQLSSLPARLFQNTRNLTVVSMAGNKLQRIEDGTFQNNPNLESVNVANNRLVHFDLSLIPSLYDADVNHNLLQELKIFGEIVSLDASNNQIRNVVAQAGNKVIVLNLSHNKLNTTGWLKPFKNLQSLDLSFNEIEDVTATDFQQMTALNTLKLNNNRLFTFNMQSRSSRSLRILDLSHNNLVNVATDLNQFQQIEELYLDHNFIVTVNLKKLKNLRNLTLSHNDWDCAKLASLSGRLPATTEVDYDTETHCKQDYTHVSGICCAVSDIPYHDRLIKYMAEVSVYERINRNNARCSGNTVYDMVKNQTLAKEVEALKTEVRHLERSTGQASSQMSRDANKIDELMRMYYKPEQKQSEPWENLRKVFNHLKDRDARRTNETISRDSERKYKEEEVVAIESQINQIARELNGKRDKYSETRKQIATKTHEVKKLQAQKNKKAQARRYS